MKHKLLLIFSFFYVSFGLCQEAPVPIALIDSLVVTEKTIQVVPNPEFKKNYLYSNFFVEYETDIDLTKYDASITCAPFIMNVIPIIWISGKSYVIERLDQDLFDALEKIKQVFKLFYPKTDWSGQLVVETLVKNNVGQPADGQAHLAALFSGGLDAVATSFNHVTHKQLLITVWGSDVKINQEEMWSKVKQHCKQFAETYGHEHACVKSNFLSFIKKKHLSRLSQDVPRWWAYTLQGLGYTGLALPLAFDRGIAHLLIASTRTSSYPFPYGTHPLIDSNIMLAGVQVHHDAHDQDRLQKIRTIVNACATHRLEKPALRVCWGKDEQGGNCCKCEKCIRTINELLLENEKPKKFGFAVTKQQAIATTKHHFKKEPKLSGGLIWHWNCIKSKAATLLENAQESSLAHYMSKYLEWITQINLEQMRKKQESYHAEDQNLFASLWKEISEQSDLQLQQAYV